VKDRGACCRSDELMHTLHGFIRYAPGRRFLVSALGKTFWGGELMELRKEFFAAAESAHRASRRFLAKHPVCAETGCSERSCVVQRERGRPYRAVCSRHAGVRLGAKVSERRAARPGGNTYRPDCGPDHMRKYRY
jgi:hypothetical protein